MPSSIDSGYSKGQHNDIPSKVCVQAQASGRRTSGHQEHRNSDRSCLWVEEGLSFKGGDGVHEIREHEQLRPSWMDV